jgi:hypothetical protein
MEAALGRIDERLGPAKHSSEMVGAKRQEQNDGNRDSNQPENDRAHFEFSLLSQLQALKQQ